MRKVREDRFSNFQQQRCGADSGFRVVHGKFPDVLCVDVEPAARFKLLAETPTPFISGSGKDFQPQTVDSGFQRNGERPRSKRAEPRELPVHAQFARMQKFVETEITALRLFAFQFRLQSENSREVRFMPEPVRRQSARPVPERRNSSNIYYTIKLRD